MFSKELLHIFRNAYFIKQIISIILVVIAYIIFIHSDYYQYELLTSYRKVWFGFFSNISILIFVSVYFSSTIAYPLISIEKFAIIKLKMLPSKAIARIIWNKIIISFTIIASISSIIYWDHVIFVRNVFDFDLSFHLFGYFYILFTIFFLVIINISFGMYFFNDKAKKLLTSGSLIAFVLSIFFVTFIITYYGEGFKAFYLYITTDFRDEQVYPNTELLKILTYNFSFVFISTILFLRMGFRQFLRYEI